MMEGWWENKEENIMKFIMDVRNNSVYMVVVLVQVTRVEREYNGGLMVEEGREYNEVYNGSKEKNLS